MLRHTDISQRFFEIIAAAFLPFLLLLHPLSIHPVMTKTPKAQPITASKKTSPIYQSSEAFSPCENISGFLEINYLVIREVIFHGRNCIDPCIFVIKMDT